MTGIQFHRYQTSAQFGKLANLTLREWPERLWPQESDTLPELAQTVDGIERDTGGNAMRDNDQFGVVGIVCDAACFPLTDGGVGFLQNPIALCKEERT